MLAQARSHNLEAIRDLTEYFALEQQQSLALANKAQQNLDRDRTRRPDDVHVAKLRTLSNIYTHLHEKLRKTWRHITYCTQTGEPIHPIDWSPCEDHQIHTQPYFGEVNTQGEVIHQLSLLDMAHLIEGICVPPAHPHRGISAISLPGYGTLSCNHIGWHLTIMNNYHETRVYQVAGALLSEVLARAITFEYVPYGSRCVLPTTGWRGTFDGISCVIAPQTVLTLDGETIEWEHPVRLSMETLVYKTLVESVADLKYEGMQAHRLAGQITRKLWPDKPYHVPENEFEMQYWLKHLCLEKRKGAAREECFLLGRFLSGYSECDLESLEVFTATYLRLKEQRAKADVWQPLQQAGGLGEGGEKAGVVVATMSDEEFDTIKDNPF